MVRDIPIWTPRPLLALCLVLLTLAAAGCSEPPKPTIGLYLAIERGDLDQVERHVHWGTDINAMNPDGQRPLHAAARAGRIVISRVLVDNGADIDAENREGHTPLYVALMQGRTQLAEMLVERGAEIEPSRLLHAMVDNAVVDRDVVEFLIERGAQINAEDASGDPPLIKAARQGDRRLAKLLIDYGADVNARGASGHTSLWWAEDSQNPDLLKLLHRHGAVAE